MSTSGAQVPLLQKEPLPQSEGTTHATHDPLEQTLPPFCEHEVPLVTGTIIPCVPTQVPIMHWFVVVGGSDGSATVTMPPVPLHTGFWQSPGIVSVSAV